MSRNTQVPPPPPLPKLNQIDPNLLTMGALMSGLFVIFIFLKLLERSHRQGKARLGRARLAKKTEWAKAQAKARSAIIKAHRNNDFSQFGGWVGEPATVLKYGRFLGLSESQLFLNRLNEHALMLAGTGSGKSYSVLDPLTRSFIRQFFSLIIFDYKGDEESDTTCAPSSALAGYALAHGYKVRVVAPGYPDSDRINLLDYVTDSASAYELASVMHANMQRSNNTDGKNEGFFSTAGKLLMQGIFLLAKTQPCEGVRDIAFCHKILALPDLIKRIQCKKLPQYIKVVFDQFLSTTGSPETAASIAATAQGLFARFQIPPAWSTFCGESNVPILLGEKELVIYRMNPLLEEALSPLIAASMYLQSRANIFGKRQTKMPCVAVWDEFSRVVVPDLGKLMSIARSKRFAFVLASQAIPVIEESYGKIATKAIMANAKTMFVGQLLCEDTIQHFSKSYGKEDIRYYNSSTSHQHGAMMGGSNSDSDSLTTRDLIPSEELAEAPQGTFYMRSPIVTGTIDGKRRERILTRIEIKIPDKEVRSSARARANWFRFRNKKIRKPIAVSLSERQLEARERYADEFLPMPASEARQAFSKLMRS
jgi:type IV secretory pathway TraG/TraD family ATPase VirD4